MPAGDARWDVFLLAPDIFAETCLDGSHFQTEECTTAGDDEDDAGAGGAEEEEEEGEKEEEVLRVARLPVIHNDLAMCW